MRSTPTCWHVGRASSSRFGTVRAPRGWSEVRTSIGNRSPTMDGISRRSVSVRRASPGGVESMLPPGGTPAPGSVTARDFRPGRLRAAPGDGHFRITGVHLGAVPARSREALGRRPERPRPGDRYDGVERRTNSCPIELFFQSFGQSGQEFLTASPDERRMRGKTSTRSRSDNGREGCGQLSRGANVDEDGNQVRCCDQRRRSP